MAPLFDAYGRPLTNLRVMITGRCNFSCFFCHMEGYRENEAARIELNLEEIDLLGEAAKRLGVTAVKITGGEPTIRDDLADIISTLRRYVKYVSMTTNASLIHRHLPAIAEAGIGHVNVSLHAMSPDSFRRVTGSTLYDRVVRNIVLLREHGIPVKINFVILRNINENDVEKLIDFAARIDAKVQFIELHPVGKAVKKFRDHHLPRWRILERLEHRIVEIKYRIGLHNRPIVMLDNGVEVEIVGPVGNYLFCAGCTRIRVTYDFKLIPCLNWRGPPVEVRPRLAKAETREDKVRAIIEAIRDVNKLRKPYVMYPVKAPPVSQLRKWRTARLGLPKSSGELNMAGNGGSALRRLLEEWGSYTV